MKAGPIIRPYAVREFGWGAAKPIGPRGPGAAGWYDPKVNLLPRAVLLCAVPLFAQVPNPATAEIKANYTKHEYAIAMRDGKKLFTSVYAPKDRSKRYPILMSRTPYSVRPYGIDQYRAALGPSDHFRRAGYIFV